MGPQIWSRLTKLKQQIHTVKKVIPSSAECHICTPIATWNASLLMYVALNHRCVLTL